MKNKGIAILIMSSLVVVGGVVVFAHFNGVKKDLEKK